MIKTNGNIKPKPFLKMAVERKSEADTGSKESLLYPQKHMNYALLEGMIENNFNEIKHLFEDLIDTVSDFNELMYLFKFKGSNIGRKKVEYSYYLIPKKAILNSYYKTSKRNNIIVELDPNYIFDYKYVDQFFNKYEFKIDEDKIKTIKVDGVGFNILIDLHSYIRKSKKTEESKYVASNISVQEMEDGIYPFIIEGARGNTSNFLYFARVKVITHDIEGIKHKVGYIID